MSSLLLLLALATAPATTACPPMSMPPPRYPIEVMRRGKPGTARLLARVDECGRVLEASVETSSGQSALDKAALAAVQAWVLGVEKRAQIKGDEVLLPVGFGAVRTIVPAKPDWPKSHRRPFYREDAQPLGFATIAEFRASKVVRSDQVLDSPYAARQRDDGIQLVADFQQDAADARTFWLTYLARKPPARQDGRMVPSRAPAVAVAVARYRLVEEAGQPVVRLAFLCEDTPEHCAEMSAYLAKGLPSARARAE